MDRASLLSLLSEEKNLLQYLIELSLDEREGIINGDMELIVSSRAKKEEAGDRLKRLEARRIALAGRETLSEAAASLPETERRELLALGEEIKKLARRVKALNTTNIFLLKKDLAYLKHLEEKAFSRLTALPYNGKGQLRKASRESLTSMMA
ncbi:MAG TPA: flagellar protein FlgN [Firmicutes bacterium]|nr:flagellar protein FlgN [Bacillota bacterium]